MHKHLLTAAAVVLTTAAGVASAQVVAYDEDVTGDFSNDAAAPTPVVFVIGDNLVSGRVGVASDPNDAFSDGRDVFGFTVAPGTVINSIVLDEYSVDNTTGIDVNMDGSDLGNVTMRDEVVGEELLGRQVLGGDVALPDTLGPGDYSFNLAEFGEAVDYTLSFNVAVPEPASLGLLSVAGLGLLRRRK